MEDDFHRFRQPFKKHSFQRLEPILSNQPHILEAKDTDLEKPPSRARDGLQDAPGLLGERRFRVVLRAHRHFARI